MYVVLVTKFLETEFPFIYDPTFKNSVLSFSNKTSIKPNTFSNPNMRSWQIPRSLSQSFSSGFMSNSINVHLSYPNALLGVPSSGNLHNHHTS